MIHLTAADLHFLGDNKKNGVGISACTGAFFSASTARFYATAANGAFQPRH